MTWLWFYLAADVGCLLGLVTGFTIARSLYHFSASADSTKPASADAPANQPKEDSE